MSTCGMYPVCTFGGSAYGLPARVVPNICVATELRLIPGTLVPCEFHAGAEPPNATALGSAAALGVPISFRNTVMRSSLRPSHSASSVRNSFADRADGRYQYHKNAVLERSIQYIILAGPCVMR